MATRDRPSTVTPVTLRLRRTFAAPRERVFRAWTVPEEMKQWKAPGDMTTPVAEVDLRPGGLNFGFFFLVDKFRGDERGQ